MQQSSRPSTVFAINTHEVGLRRRRALALAGLPLIGLASVAKGQAFPAGPIRILVGFPAGGTIDVVTREVAERLSAELKVPVTVENPTGAGGQIAAVALKRAAADGKTLMVAPDHTAVILPLTLSKPGFEMVPDFKPVGLVADYECALAVSQSSGIQDVAGFLSYLKANPGASIGVAAPGSKPVFAISALARRLQVSVQAAPYRGSVPLVQDLAGGHIPAGITALGDFIEFEKAGKLRVIAMVGSKRASQRPDVPTAMELGLPIEANFWIGLFAPAGVPAPVVERLNRALNTALASEKVRTRMANLVFNPRPGKPGELANRIDAESRQWEPRIIASGWVKQ